MIPVAARSGTQGDFGGDVLPLYPALWHELRGQQLRVHNPGACPHGHRVDGAGSFSWNAKLGLHELWCHACPPRPAHNCWALIDPAVQRGTGDATGDGLELVAVPPVLEAAPGRIEIHLACQAVGAVEVQLCALDKTG
jgi:hypothetical protein